MFRSKRTIYIFSAIALALTALGCRLSEAKKRFRQNMI